MKSKIKQPYIQFKDELDHVEEEGNVPARAEKSGEGSVPARMKQLSHSDELAVVKAKEDILQESFNSVDELIPEKKKPINFLSVFKLPRKSPLRPAARETLILRLMKQKGFEREVA